MGREGGVETPTLQEGIHAVGALALLGGSPADARSGDATVTVVHGIPDTPVDVYVNDELTLDDLAFGSVTDPLALPAGDYPLAVHAADGLTGAQAVGGADRVAARAA